MDGIMHGAIHKITKDESREEHECLLADNQEHESKNDRGDDQARYGWHEQALFISWIMMMIAMQCINEFPGSFTSCHHMKKKPVRYVFKKRPEKHTA